MTDVGIRLSTTRTGPNVLPQTRQDMLGLVQAQQQLGQAARQNTLLFDQHGGTLVRTQQAVTATGAAAVQGSRNFGIMRGAMTGLAIEATGVAGPLGRLASTALMFSGGGMLAVGVAAGAGAIGLAIRAMGAEAREAAERMKTAHDRARELLDDADPSRAPRREQAGLARDLARARINLQDLRTREANRPEFETVLRGPAGEERPVQVPTVSLRPRIDQAAHQVQDLERSLAALGTTISETAAQAREDARRLMLERAHLGEGPDTEKLMAGLKRDASGFKEGMRGLLPPTESIKPQIRAFIDPLREELARLEGTLVTTPAAAAELSARIATLRAEMQAGLQLPNVGAALNPLRAELAALENTLASTPAAAEQLRTRIAALRLELQQTGDFFAGPVRPTPGFSGVLSESLFRGDDARRTALLPTERPRIEPPILPPPPDGRMITLQNAQSVMGSIETPVERIRAQIQALEDALLLPDLSVERANEYRAGIAHLTEEMGRAEAMTGVLAVSIVNAVSGAIAMVVSGGSAGGFLAGLGGVLSLIPGMQLPGAIVSGVGAVVSAAEGRESRGVRIDEFSRQAVEQMRETRPGPDVVSLVLTDVRGREISRVEYELNRRSRLDRQERIPSGSRLS